jgi:hypothetical protein
MSVLNIDFMLLTNQIRGHTSRGGQRSGRARGERRAGRRRWERHQTGVRRSATELPPQKGFGVQSESLRKGVMHMRKKENMSWTEIFEMK